MLRSIRESMRVKPVFGPRFFRALILRRSSRAWARSTWCTTHVLRDVCGSHTPPGRAIAAFPRSTWRRLASSALSGAGEAAPVTVLPTPGVRGTSAGSEFLAQAASVRTGIRADSSVSARWCAVETCAVADTLPGSLTGMSGHPTGRSRMAEPTCPRCGHTEWRSAGILREAPGRQAVAWRCVACNWPRPVARADVRSMQCAICHEMNRAPRFADWFTCWNCGEDTPVA